jgi:predicted dehydrogenase
MKEIVDSGAIGKVRAVWVRHFVGMGSFYYFHDWHGVKRNTNSLLLQKGSHDIDMIHWITGKYTRRVSAFGSLDMFGGSHPDDLTCPECTDKDTCNESSSDPRLCQCAFRREIDVEDNYVSIMEMEDGVKTCYLECHFSADHQRNYVFIGTQGQVENSELENKVWVKRRKHAGVLQQEAEETYDIADMAGGHGGADPRICDDFVDVVLLDKEPAVTPIAGRMSVATGDAATRSLRSGGFPVDVAPIDWGTS